MRTPVLALAAFLMFLGESRAATVAWDFFQLTSASFSGSGSGRTWNGTFSTNGQQPVGESGAFVDFYISFVVTRTTGTPVKAKIAPDTEFLVLDGPESNWILANEGDLVDESTSRHLGDSYFFHTAMDDEGYGGTGSIEFLYGETCQFYLGFSTGLPNWETGVHCSSDIYYGWALFEYSAGKVSLVRSALNTEGGGIYVGTDRTTPVPEPASCALAFLGAVLLLRRRRN